MKAQKQAQEQAFQQWADKNTLPEEGYQDALPKMKAAIEKITPAQGTMQYLQEALLNGVELISAAGRSNLTSFYKDYDVDLDRKVAKRMFQIVKENMKPEDLPSIYRGVIDPLYGGSTDDYVDWLYDNSMYTSPEKLALATEESLKNDPAARARASVIEVYRKAYAEYAKYSFEVSDAHRLYVAGLMKMDPAKAWYSDANFTIRLTYGQVLPYDPADAVTYNYFTTLEGVIAKEDNTNPLEFTVEPRLKELYAAKDYGRYADADGKLHVGFLANLDITGGNSGSPMLDGYGRLIGLAFDGNWEAMSGDVAFEPELQRCIGVDIRYVLWVVDKFAGCQHIMDELTIVGGAKAKKAKNKKK